MVGRVSTKTEKECEIQKFLFIGPGTGTQCALRGHTGKLRQGVGRERGALSKGEEKKSLDTVLCSS